MSMLIDRSSRRLALPRAPQSHHRRRLQPGRMQWLGQLFQDSRYAFRTLWRRPTYALLCVLTLALGVGGTASVYGVARGVLFDPLPFAHEREVGVFWKKTDWTHEEYLYIRGRVPGFSQVALYRQRDVMLRHGDGPARLV